jgi:predicted nucleotidyltransferase component of viral defense system
MNETALKERIKIIAKTKGVTFNEIWKQILLERFLARLSRSKYHENFIFKGGLLLSQRIQIGRETVDIDFLMTQLKSKPVTIESAIREVIAVEIRDGFQFKWQSMQELTQPHVEYPGFRVHLNCVLEKMRDTIQIDIGIGDVVHPIKNYFYPFEYKGKPIFEGEITLLTYPMETIFAEKLEAILSKGAVNSRMKDYHDVLLMIREERLLDTKKLQLTIMATFKHRGTRLQLPIAFDQSGISSLEKLWKNHLKGLGVFRSQLRLPEGIKTAIEEINTWLMAKGIQETSK